MEEKARNRLIFCWRMANRFPVTIVAIASIISIIYHMSCMGWKTRYNMVMKIKATEPLEMTERNEVTATGEPS